MTLTFVNSTVITPVWVTFLGKVKVNSHNLSGSRMVGWAFLKSFSIGSQYLYIICVQGVDDLITIQRIIYTIRISIFPDSGNC